MPFNPINIGEIVCQRGLVIFVSAVILPDEAERLIWVSYPVVIYPSRLEHWRMAKPSPKHAGEYVLVSLGETIRTMRQKQGLSQEALANAAGLDRSYVGGIERGEHNLTLMNLLKIAEQLDMAPSELFKLSGF